MTVSVQPSISRFADDDANTLNTFANRIMSEIYTSLVCTVISVNLNLQTISCKPTVMGQFKDKDGVWQDVDYPVLMDVPIVFPSGGGCVITLPVAIGDECLVVFSSRCIDNWFATGESGPVSEHRKVDLSDGIAIVGIRSVPNVVSSVHSTNIQIRSLAGTSYIELNPTSGEIHLHSPVPVKITGGGLVVEGPIYTPNVVTADNDVIGGGKSLKTHIHSGVQTGSGNSGPPV